MVDDPAFIADIFSAAGADMITFHEEAVKDPEQIRAVAAKIHKAGKKAGSVNQARHSFREPLSIPA
jgi:ribulose-phosphate 3-epimerase